MRGVDEGDHLALVGHVQRVQPEERSRPTRRPRAPGSSLRQFDADAGAARDLDDGGDQPATGRVTQHVHAPSGLAAPPAWPATSRCSGALSVVHDGPELDALAHAHDGHAVLADVPDTMTRSPGRARSGPMSHPVGTTPTPAVLTNSWSALPLPTTLVSPVTMRHPRVGGRPPMVSATAPSTSSSSPSSRMNPAVSATGSAPLHRQVVDGAVDREVTDVAAREEKRLHHIGVGGEGDPLRRTSSSAESRAGPGSRAERRQEQVLDQLLGQHCRRRRAPARPAWSRAAATGTPSLPGRRSRAVSGTPSRPAPAGGTGSTQRRRPRWTPSWRPAGFAACSDVPNAGHSLGLSRPCRTSPRGIRRTPRPAGARHRTAARRRTRA